MSKKTQYKLCLVLIAANLIFIWGNSATPGETSGSISGWLLELLRFLPNSEQAHTILRKIAHFSEFACLGLLVGWFSIIHFGQPSPRLLGIGLAVACIDETIQIFSPGRYSSLIDVWIDTAGFTTGLILLTLGYNIYKRIKNREDTQS